MRIWTTLGATPALANWPKPALLLLAAIVTDQPWGARELGQCLDLIMRADAGLGQDPSYQRLREYARRWKG